MATPPREAIQKQIQQDWANREYIEVITVSIKKITDFLNSFDMSCRSKLALLNEKLTTLERKIDYLEACVREYLKENPFKIIEMFDFIGDKRRNSNIELPRQIRGQNFYKDLKIW